MPVKVPIWGCNLGDTLWTTPLSKYIPDIVVQMLSNDARSRLTAPILDGICSVEFVEKTIETPKDNSVVAHVTQRILFAYGQKGNSIPFVKIKPEEIQWAIDFFKSKNVDVNNSIIFVNNNSGVGDPTNYRAHYVRPNPQIINNLALFWAQSAGKTILQFGPSSTYYDKDPFDPIPNAIHIRGLTVRQLAACYYLVGKMISGDTGDYHLMIAVGGRVCCLVPPHSDSFGYKHWDLLYDNQCWDMEPRRVFYCLHENWQILKNTKIFT
jgi:hypothetical protein